MFLNYLNKWNRREDIAMENRAAILKETIKMKRPFKYEKDHSNEKDLEGSLHF